MADLAIPDGADLPLRTGAYYNFVPLQQPDPANPLVLAVQDNSFEDATPIVFTRSRDAGNAHFRLEDAGAGAFVLRSRNSSKPVAADQQKGFLQMPQAEMVLPFARMYLMPARPNLYKICSAMNPTGVQAVVAGGGLPAPGKSLGGGNDGLLFYAVPAQKFEWMDSGQTGGRQYQDAAELQLRALLDGIFGFIGDTLKEQAEVPGGGIALKIVLSLIWPQKTLSSILEEFRQNLLDDVRALQAQQATIDATNKLTDIQRRYLMQYNDTKRMHIDVAAELAALKTSAETYANEYSSAVIGLLPGVVGSDGKISTPIDAKWHSLIRSGLGVYVQGAIAHISAAEERALVEGFSPKNVIRNYPQPPYGDRIIAGTDDVLRATHDARDIAKTVSLINVTDNTISDADQISLQTPNNMFVSACFGGDSELRAIGRTRSAFETFRLVRVDGDGRLKSGDRIALVSSSGRYVAATADGTMTVSDQNRTAAATFTIRKKSGDGNIRGGDEVGLVASNGKFVSAIDGGGHKIAATSPHLSGWETFRIGRANVGNVLRYGNEVVFRRPSDGRFATAIVRDGKTILSMESGTISTQAIFTIRGGTEGNDVSNKGAYSLQAKDNRYVGVDPEANNTLILRDAGWDFSVDIVRGEPSMLEAGEPADWVDAHAKMYIANLKAMYDFLVAKRRGEIAVSRKTVKNMDFIEVTDRTLGRTFFRWTDRGPQDYAATQRIVDDVRRQYEEHIAINELARYRPLDQALKLGDAGPATTKMYNRLRRSLDVSTEYWRKAVIPPRSEWKA